MDVIGKIALAAVELLPKIDGIDSPVPPVDVAFVVVVIVDRILFDIVWSLSQFIFTMC